MRLRAASRGIKTSSCLQRYSLTITRPLCNARPLFDGRVHSLLDFHSIFGYERMHNIQLGLTRMLCDLFPECLMSKTMETSVIVSRHGEAKTFYQIWTLVLRACNYLLSSCDKYSRETRLRLDFGKQKSQKGLDSFFMSYGVIGMLRQRTFMELCRSCHSLPQWETGFVANNERAPQ